MHFVGKEIESSPRFTGHETFACRFAWLPKAVRAVGENAELFSDVDQAMVTLGVGKNMVHAIRFWAEAADVVEPMPEGKGCLVSEFGKTLLGEKGCDPFMEDIRTLWLIHWKIATNRRFRVFAWDFFLNQWQEPEISASTALEVLRRHVRTLDREPLSDNVLAQQFDIFLHSYVPTRGRKKGEVREDTLDCPLVELNLLQETGVRRQEGEKGERVESIYAFRRETKKEITPGLFAYCLDDFWHTWQAGEQTLAFPTVLHGRCGLGQVFKLPEDDLRARCENLERDTEGYFVFQESALQPVIKRAEGCETRYRLRQVYGAAK
ncbi:MAG: DUF4007 family protein [Kiritimatiellia bacterium]